MDALLSQDYEGDHLNSILMVHFAWYIGKNNEFVLFIYKSHERGQK